VISGEAGERWYSYGMEYIDYIWIKAGLIVLAAFLYGLFGGDVSD
jgi:hypothetical protein